MSLLASGGTPNGGTSTSRIPVSGRDYPDEPILDGWYRPSLAAIWMITLPVLTSYRIMAS